MNTTPKSFTLYGSRGMQVTVLDYGAIIQYLKVPDTMGQLKNVVLGFPEPTQYFKNPVYLGAIVGRCAGRISKGGFKINNKHYAIYQKEGVHLHGGEQGFNKKYWKVEGVNGNPVHSIELSYTSPHLEEGYPGNLKVRLRYAVSQNNELTLTYTAQTDEPTVVNLTNHSYFNIDGAGKTVKNQKLRLKASHILDTFPNLLPTGKIKPVNNSIFDFREALKIENTLLDDTFVFDACGTGAVASILSDASGIKLDVFTNQPAAVVFIPKGASAICFETQKHPDAVHFSDFPSTILYPGQKYHSKTVFSFKQL